MSEIATFAADVFGSGGEVPDDSGVEEAIVGYSGGKKENPTYKECARTRRGTRKWCR